MDYTNDACMFMFSSGQAAVAEAYVMSIQSTFKQDVVSCTALSVDEFSLENALNIWPNPSNGEINISLNIKNSGKVNISLYDLRGRLINNQSFTNSGTFSNKLNYSNLESSVYIDFSQY